MNNSNEKNNLEMKKIKKNRKIIIPKKPTMYDKINNYFKSYDFIKLQLLGEDNSNFDNFIYQGYIYKPKKIKVEYLGNKKIKGNLLLPGKSIKNNYTSLKKKEISFKNPIFEINEKININKSNSFYNQNLPIIPKIKKPNYKLYNNKSYNFNDKNNNNNNSYNMVKIKNEKRVNITTSNSVKNINGNNIINYNIKKIITPSNRSNSNSYMNISSKYILKNTNILNLKKQLKKNMDLLENQVNNSFKFISNGSKINEDEKPQFKLRFNNLNYNFKKYLD